MAERTYRNVDVDLDDLADAIIDWFERDGFEVQDFLEGPSIFVQARKSDLVSKVSFTAQALNVRLSPLSRGFRVEIGAGEWLDKGVGAGVTAVALRFINPIVALGTGALTAYGIYQQAKLPDQLLHYVEAYVSRHGVDLGDRELEERSPRNGRGRGAERADDRRYDEPRYDDRDVDDELEALRAERRDSRNVELGPGRRVETDAPTAPATKIRVALHCPNCNAEVSESDNFCPECGTNLRDNPPVSEGA